jgi:hypothetical protein
MQNFIKNHKRSLIVFGLLIIATIVSATAAYCPNGQYDQKPNNIEQTTINKEIINTSTVATKTDSTDNFSKSTSTNITNSTDTSNNLTAQQQSEAKLIVGDRTYKLRFTTGEKLIDAMERLQLISDQPFSLVTKEYTGMGKFVEEINGVKNSPTTNEYWGYYINGKSAQIGASSYILKEGDNIEWKYAKTNF